MTAKSTCVQHFIHPFPIVCVHVIRNNAQHGSYTSARCSGLAPGSSKLLATPPASAEAHSFRMAKLLLVVLLRFATPFASPPALCSAQLPLPATQLTKETTSAILLLVVPAWSSGSSQAIKCNNNNAKHWQWLCRPWWCWVLGAGCRRSVWGTVNVCRAAFRFTVPLLGAAPLCTLQLATAHCSHHQG